MRDEKPLDDTTPRMRVEDIREVCARTNLARTSIYHLVKAGEFPKPILLTRARAGRRGWITHEVDAWIEARMAERE